ncbi:MAG: DUF296 domain-containing protein [Proteobacteria bacterium]|nr:DUF296 domain-containing protein [Pseudomonadota bacterium]
MDVPGIECRAAMGRPGRLIAARLLPGQDLIEGVTALIKAAEFKSGSVSAIGSLRSASVAWARKMFLDGDIKNSGVFYEMEGPVELGLGFGFFGHNPDGEFFMHLHGLIQDKEGNMRCGNLVPGSAPVLATVELTVQEIEGLDMNYTIDPEWKHHFPWPINI